MNGIEACFTAKVVSEPENRISNAGNAWMRFSVMIGEGDDAQFCQVAVFGDVAAKLSGHIAKLSKVYCEGRLKLDRWETKDGEKRSGLSLAAWRCDILGQIEMNKPARQKSVEPAPALKNIAAHQLAEAAFKAEPHSRERPKIVGRDDFDFGDRISF